MENIFRLSERIPPKANFALLADERKKFASSLLSAQEKRWIASVRGADPEKKFIPIQRVDHWAVVIFFNQEDTQGQTLESCRRSGSRLADMLAENNIPTIYLTASGTGFIFLSALAEGLALAGYRFLRYLSPEKVKKQANPLKDICIVHPKPDTELLRKLAVTIKYTFLVRDLVNQPPSDQNARGFAGDISQRATALGIKAEVFNKSRIEALKMGGLLAVNRGSVDPPTFTVLEWRPEEPVNTHPVVLVGKGIIFDTGGMNLKTGSFMEGMKSDMAGAALMAATIMAVAELSLPLYLVALLPATDNRVDGNAFLPGDVIMMHDGTTVEIKNTDAEGRLILGDAISYAKRYDPLLVMDAATLTGSAMRAIGHYGVVAMQSKAPKEMELLKKAGQQVYERVAEFPMWKEYDEQLKSDIADLANLGGVNGGAIVAAKFLEHFTASPFVHLDIAGPAFIEKRENYIPKGGTGFGLRLLVEFLQSLSYTIQSK